MRPNFQHALAIHTLALLVATALPAHASDPGPRVPLYRPIDLGALPGWTRIRAVDVNDKRQVTGTLNNAAGGMPFVWLPRPDLGLPAGMTALGTLPLGASNAAFPGAIDDCGRIVGTAQGSTPGVMSTVRGFVWQDGVMHEIGALAGLGNSWSGAMAINRKGTVVGWSGQLSTTSTMHAFSTRIRCGDRPSGDLVDLGSLSEWWSMAKAVNDKDQVVGMTSFLLPSGSSTSAPFFYDSVGGLVDLPFPAGANAGHANAINERSVVVGACSTIAALPVTERAALWRRTGAEWSVTELGPFLGRARNAPTAIDDQDRVIGWSFTGDPFAGQAFLWIDGAFHALDDLLVTREPVRIIQTGGINRRGDIAVTGYTTPGEYRAFLLVRVR